MSIDPQDTDSRDTAPQDAAETETQVLPQAPESSETPTVVAPPADEVVTESDETEVVQTVVIETETVETAVIETETVETETAPAEAPQPEAVPTEMIPTEVIPVATAPFEAAPDGTASAEAAPAAPRPRRRGVFLAAWLGSALVVGALTGGGILAADPAKKAAPVAAPSPSPSPTTTVPAGVRSDGTHYGPLTAFLLPMPSGYGPGPDEGLFGNNSAVTPDQLDAEVTELFGKLQASDLTSAKGAMESAHMTAGAVRTYLKSTSDLEFSILALQLDPSMAAKSTGDFLRIVKTSEMFRTGPAVPGHPEAQCVLPATLPGDKLDEMLCLATVGDTFVIGEAAGTVPMDQKSVTALFANQVDLLKNGPAQ